MWIQPGTVATVGPTLKICVDVSRQVGKVRVGDRKSLEL